MSARFIKVQTYDAVGKMANRDRMPDLILAVDHIVSLRQGGGNKLTVVRSVEGSYQVSHSVDELLEMIREVDESRFVELVSEVYEVGS